MTRKKTVYLAADHGTNKLRSEAMQIQFDAFTPALNLVSIVSPRSRAFIDSTMSGFEPNRVYSVAVHETPAANAPETPAETEKLLLEFIQAFRVGEEYIYR